ncbi:hypothetical protein Tco_1424851, partial [Tanacetum coccineum]
YNKNYGPKQSGPKTFNANSASSTSASSEKGVTLSFTNEQMMKLMSLINEAPTGSVQANMTDYLSDKVVLFDVLVVPEYCVSLLLGHPSDQAVDVLQNELNFTRDLKVSPCDICHKAKQTREPFPISDHQTTSIGELVHLNMWGPYKVIS